MMKFEPPLTERRGDSHLDFYLDLTARVKSPDVHKRRSIRLKDYDYSQAGAYFVTICIHSGLHLLGNIVNQQIIPSDAGLMVLNNPMVWEHDLSHLEKYHPHP